MNILNLCHIDSAGVAYRLTDAINKHTKHKSRQLVHRKHGYDYPYDIHTTDHDEFRKWVRWADIVNCWNKTILLQQICEKIPDKLIITHGGSHFSEHPEIRHEEATDLKARELVVVPAFLKFEGQLWLPHAVPVDEWFEMKTKHKGAQIVCQSTSKWGSKRTYEVLKSLTGLDRPGEDRSWLISLNGREVEFKVIDRVGWHECMKLKAEADIYLGEFNLGYGMSELEAMAMKIPVITKLKEENAVLTREEVGTLPHYVSPIENLRQAISLLLSDEKLYNNHVNLGFRYVKKFHDYPIVAKRFISYCEKLF